MKKLILLLTLAFVMCGCVSTNEDGSLKLNTGVFTESHVVIQEELIRKIKEQ